MKLPNQTLLVISLLVSAPIVLSCHHLHAEGAKGHFQEEMGRLLGETPGPDDSGDVHHLGGLAAYYTGPKNLLPGKGRSGGLYKFMPIIRWYDPAYYYNQTDFRPGSTVEGEFSGEQCVLCHKVETPGVVVQWKKSRHSNPSPGKEVVGCEKCHGNNHQRLTMPSYNVCGECHPRQTSGQRAGGRGSHAQAYHLDLIETGCMIEKPAEEGYACLGCHAIENRCDGCHTRHEFSSAEARRSSSCAVCHSGPEQYEYEMYMQSYHGILYQAEEHKWDWSQPLTPENYKVPTCAYCHMHQGEHNETKLSTAYTYMGSSLVDRGAPRYRHIREAWVKICQGCHSPRFARDHLEAMDAGTKLSFAKYREAMAIVIDLYEEGLIDPMPKDLAPDWRGHFTFSLLPGKGEVRKYNISEIERLTYEMLVDIICGIYKAKAHSAWYSPIYGFWEWAQDRWLVQIKNEASHLRRLAEIEKKLGLPHTAYDFWKHGEYTDMLLGWKRIGADPAKNSDKD